MKCKNRKFNFQLILTILIYTAFSSFITAQNQAGKRGGNEFSYVLPASQNPLSISTSSTELNSKWIFPELLNKKVNKENWRYISRSSSKKKLAGIDGKVTTDVFECSTLRVRRDFWISNDNTKIALRQKVTNLLKEPVKGKETSR